MDESIELDPLVAGAAAWMALNAKREATIRKWQRLETKLFAKAKAQKMNVEAAERSNWPEARTMRQLARRIDAHNYALESEAQRLSAIPATTVASAIAKVRLGLEVQGPFDWRPCAHELLSDGWAELCGLTSTAVNWTAKPKRIDHNFQPPYLPMASRP
jgi:hypothetical protein